MDSKSSRTKTIPMSAQAWETSVMGLDENKLEDCIELRRYGAVIDDYSRFAVAQGVIGTPALLVKTDTDRDWSMPPCAVMRRCRS